MSLVRSNTKKILPTDELKNDWIIKAIEVCPEGEELTEEDFLESVRVFQGPGAMRVKAASEAFKCKLSLRGFGTEGKIENGIWVPFKDSAPPMIIMAAKNEKKENLSRAIEWAKTRVRQVAESIEDEFQTKIKTAEAKIKAAKAAVESRKKDAEEDLKKAKKEQIDLQKFYVKELKKTLLPQC